MEAPVLPSEAISLWHDERGAVNAQFLQELIAGRWSWSLALCHRSL